MTALEAVDAILYVVLVGFLLWTQWSHESRLDRLEKDFYGPWDEDDDSEPFV